MRVLLDIAFCHIINTDMFQYYDNGTSHMEYVK